MQQCQGNTIGRLVYLTSMALKKYMENRLKPYDLTTEQFQVIKQLDLEEGKTQSVVCGAVDKSPANITRILDRLEKKGCVERRVNPADRRSSLVCLTPAGRALLDEVVIGLQGYEQEITEGLDERQLGLLKDGLQRLLTNLERISEGDSQ